jgi:hypothetical protein
VSDELAYWTVLAGPTLSVVGDIDAHLRHLRFGRACEESTTKIYASHLKRFLVWREGRGLTWTERRQPSKAGRAGMTMYLRWLAQRARDTAGYEALALADPVRAVVGERLLPSLAGSARCW